MLLGIVLVKVAAIVAGNAVSLYIMYLLILRKRLAARRQAEGERGLVARTTWLLIVGIIITLSVLIAISTMLIVLMFFMP